MVVTPMADVPALDKIHAMADEIHCLNVVDDTFEINHYFTKTMCLTTKLSLNH